MENTFEMEQATIGTAIAERIALTIQEDGIKRTMRRAVKFVAAVIACVAVAAPQYALGYLTSLVDWHDAAILKVVIVLAAFCYYRQALRFIRWARGRLNRRDPDGDQETYHGIPIEQMADYLIERRGFQREHAIRHFGISRKRQFKMADELEKNGILVRGGCNGRKLHESITRDQLVRQLRDGFPLVWNEQSSEWTDPNAVHVDVSEDEPAIAVAPGFFTRAVSAV